MIWKRWPCKRNRLSGLKTAATMPWPAFWARNRIDRMNLFSVFATMSLHDAISRPLALIRASLGRTEGGADSLSGRLGHLASSFGAVAVAAAGVLVTLAAMSTSAIAFESKMADVAKVVDFETTAELRSMSEAIQDLSLKIPIAAEGFADIVAAAAQSGVAKDDLIDFSVQAAKMGVAFDVAAGQASKTMADWRAAMGLTLDQTYALADAVNHLANNMNATAPEISEVLNRMGAVGRAAGFAETELAALAATGLSAGASAEVVGTGLNSIFATLTAGSSMSKEAAAAFKALGFEADALARSMQTDAKGTVLQVMEAIAALPRENQLSVITSAFGQMSLKSIAPMVGNLDNLRNAFNLVGDAASFAGSMEAEYAARSATTENSIQLLRNSFNVLCITIGGYFLPVINAAAQGLSALAGFLVAIGRTSAGGFLIKLAAGLAAAVIGVTGLVTALALLKPLFLMAAGAMAPVIGPLLAISAVVTLAALAWKNDFMGIATVAADFAAKVKLVFQGVYEIFSTLQNGQGELSAALAEDIEAAGLMGLVTTVSRIVYRVISFFKGLASTLWTTVQPAFSRLGEAFNLLGGALQPLFGLLGRLGGGLATAAGESDTAPWTAWGQVIGEMVGTVLSFFVDIIGVAVGVLTAMVEVITWGAEKLMSFGSACGDVLFEVVGFVEGVIDAIGEFVSAIEGGIGQAATAISNFSLAEAGSALIGTFGDGIKSGASGLVDTVGGVLSGVRDYLPFSDARKGPLSQLTASGLALPSTLARGVNAGAPTLAAATDNMMNRLNLAPPSFESPQSPIYQGRLPEPAMSGEDRAQSGFSRSGRRKNGIGHFTIKIENINLPGVREPNEFLAALEAIAAEQV